jgi:hypothetical protein
VRVEDFDGRLIQVIDFDDVSGEHVVEFVDQASTDSGAILAVYSSEDGWADAKVSISPRHNDVSAGFLEWALGVAKELIEPSAT